MCESGVDLGFDLLNQEDDGFESLEEDGFYKLKSRILEPVTARYAVHVCTIFVPLEGQRK